MRMFTAIMGLVACLAVPASAVTTQFDFGISDSVANVNAVEPDAQSVANAIDTTGASTGISLAVDFANSTGWHETGENGSGTTTPDAPALDYFSSELTEDNLYGHTGDWGGTVGDRDLIIYNIAGLDANTAYDYTFFAARSGSGQNRETSYDVDGNVALLDAYGNTDNIAQLLGIVSDGNGEAVLTIQKGPNNNNGNGFFYLGAMQINTSVPEPTSLTLLSLSGLGLVIAGWRDR